MGRGRRTLFARRGLLAGTVARYKKVLAEYVGRTQRNLNHVPGFLRLHRSRRATVANPGSHVSSMCICLAADFCEQLKRNLKFDLRQAEFVVDSRSQPAAVRAMPAPYTA